MSTINQQPEALSLAGNLQKFEITSDSEVVFILQQGAVQILNEKYQPDINGLVSVDVQPVISRLLDIVIPSTNDPVVEQTTGTGDFTATIDGAAVNFRVVKGGVAELESSSTLLWLESHLLTWQPQEMMILQHCPQWLGIYPVVSGEIRVCAYFADSSSVDGIYASLEAGKLYSVNTSWGNIAQWVLSIGAGTRGQPIAWDVFCQVAGTRMTPVQRYQLRNAGAEEHIFVWENTLGGIDSVSFTGSAEEDHQLSHKMAVYFDESIGEYDIEKTREIRQSTGYLTAEEGYWLKDFFYSRKKYVVREDGSLRRVAVVSSKILTTSQDDQCDYEFTYRLATDGQLLNLERTHTDLPAPEGLADFFLTDLLSGLTEASLSDNLIMAVQSPYAVGWQKLSLSQLIIASAGGTVSRVALELPREFEVIGQPVTGVGTLMAAWKEQLPNLVLASPDLGGTGTPRFRSLVAEDIPDLDFSRITTGVPAFLTQITKELIEAVLTGEITSHTHLFQPLNDDLSAIGSLAGTSGLLRKTASGAWLLDTASYLTAITSLMVTSALGFTPENVTNKSTAVMLGNSDTLYPTQKAVKTYADSLVAGLLDYRGGFDASGIAFPSAGGSGPSGTIMKGDMWIVSVAGTMGGVAVQAGDSVIANTDTPGQSAINWNMLNSNISYAAEDQANKSTSTALGDSDTLYPSQKAVKTYADTKQSADADLTAIAALSGTQGLLKKTAANTWTLDTSAYLTAITKAMIEAQLTGAITSHTHAAYLTGITKAMVEAVLTGAITSHSHAAYLTSITKAMVEAVLTGAITSHTHAYVAGTGTENYFPVWLTGGTGIGASLMFYEGADVVQINTNGASGCIRIGQKDAAQVAAVDYTAYGNTLVGSKASPFITTGYYNAVFGTNAGYSLTVGFKNAILAAFAASYLTTGDRNVIIGYLSGRNPDDDITQYRIIDEDDMVLIGYGASKNNAAKIVNGIAIGSGARVLLSNQAVLGNDSITSTLLKGTVTAPALKVTSAGYGAGKILQSDANGLLSFTSQPNAHNQVYVSSAQGASARGDLTGATITYTPKGNNVLVLFSNTTSNQAAAVNIHYYIHVGTNVPGSADLYFGGGQQHCSFQALYQVTAGIPITVKIQWSSSTDVWAYSNYLTVIDLP